MSDLVPYSKLCDTSLAAYLAYIAAVSVGNGWGIVKPSVLPGGDCIDSGSGRCDDSRGDVVGVYAGLLDKARYGVVEMDPDGSDDRVRRYIGGVLDASGNRSTTTNVGVASGDDGSRVSRMDRDFCDERCGNGGSDARTFSKATTGLVPNGTSAQSLLVPSVKTLENRAKRERRKQRKLRKQSPIGIDRRSRRGSFDLPGRVEIASPKLGRNGKPVDVEAVGFWKSCSEGTRRKLIESKAAMHIAENERKTREAQARVNYLDSPQAIVDQVIAVVGKAEKVVVRGDDDRVMGWAKTVTNSSAESLARSVPSTVPSLESVSSAINEAAELERERLERVKIAEHEDQVKKNLELAQVVDEMKTTIERLEREKLERDAPKSVRDVRVAVPDVNCAPVRRKGETVNEHFLRVQKYMKVRENMGLSQPVVSAGWNI